MRGMFKKCLAGIMAMVLGAGLLAGCAQDGVDGKDGETPYIGWNGNWWIGTEDTGIKAEGQDGEDGIDGTDGKDGEDGLTPHIGPNGNWWIGEEDTGVEAEGNGATDGLTPYIGENGNWWIGTEDTGIKAEGQDGEDGKDGAPGEQGDPGLTPYVGENGNWWIGEEDTGVQAEASDGLTPYIGENGNWWIGEEDTGVNASGLPVEERAPTDGLIFRPMTVGGKVGYVVTDYVGDSASVIIPDYVGALHVLGIYDYAFVDTPVTVTQVSLSKFTETIGDYAFSNNVSLFVEMRDAPLRVIGDYAFENCTIISGLEFPETMESIGSHAFYDAVTISSLGDPLALSRVPSIGDYAFNNITAPFIYLSEEVETVGENAFATETIVYAEKEVLPESWTYVSPYSSILPLGGWIISESGDWIIRVDEDGSYEIGQYIGEAVEELIVPAELDGRPVRSIGYRFVSSREISLSDGTSYVRLSEGIRSIGFAFGNMGALIAIPSSVTEFRYIELEYAQDNDYLTEDYLHSVFWAFEADEAPDSYFGEYFFRFATSLDADEIICYSEPEETYIYSHDFFFVPEGEGLSLLAAIESPYDRYMGNLNQRESALRVPALVDGVPVLSMRKASVYSRNLIGCVLESGIQEVRAGAIALTASSSYLVLPDTVSRIAMEGVSVSGAILSESLFQPELWDSQWCAEGTISFDIAGASSWEYGSFYAFTLDEEENATLVRYLGNSSTIKLPRTLSWRRYPCVAIASGFYKKPSSSRTIYIPSNYVLAESGAFVSKDSYTTTFYFEVESRPEGFAGDYYRNDYSSGRYFAEYFGRDMGY